MNGIGARAPFTSDIATPRQGLTSSVDVLPLLVSLGYGGSRSWLTGNLGQIYAERHDLLPMLRVARQLGWPVVLPHPKMLPRRWGIASAKCSRAL